MSFPMFHNQGALTSGGGLVDVVLNEHGQHVRSTSLSSGTWTVSGAAIGTASSDRLVIVAATSASGNTDHSALTIGGVSANKDAWAVNGGRVCSIWTLKVSTGTTADIALTNVGFANDARMVVYSANADYHDFAVSFTDGVGLTMNTTAGGALVVCGASSATSHTFTWTSNVDEDYDNFGTTASYAFASKETTSDDTGISVAATPSGGTMKVHAGIEIVPVGS